MTIARFKRRVLVHIALIRAIMLGAIGIVFLGLVVVSISLIGRVTGDITFVPRMAFQFLFGDSLSLLSTGTRTNILLLGVGGAGHEAPQLTDTILLVSLDHTYRNPVFISFPRDIWVPSLRAKLNTAYYYGNQKREGGGLVLAKASVSELIDQPAHYSVAVDFDGFVRLVNELGGIEVDVERTFDDYLYPIPGLENDLCGGDPEFHCRYEHIHFERGKQIISGQTALKFVRSRNGQGEEGTDFARSARQQKVTSSIKNKLLSPSVLLNPGKMQRLWLITNDTLETDIPQDKLPIVARMVLKTRDMSTKTVVLDGGTSGDAQTGFLINPPISVKYDNQWVLVPRDGDWSQVRGWVRELLK